MDSFETPKDTVSAEYTVDQAFVPTEEKLHSIEVLESPAQEFPEDNKQSYTVQFDTPEGKMEYVKKGDWSGVRPVK